MGYDGMYPGPTFDVRKDETTYVKWMNNLPQKHFLPVDTTIHGAEKLSHRLGLWFIYTVENSVTIVMDTLKLGLRKL